MELTVATWNMNHRSDDQSRAAWDLLRRLGVDVALVQESMPPPQDVHAIWNPVYAWGTAVAVFGAQPLEPVPTVQLGAHVPEGHLARSHDGAWVAARTTIGSNEIVLVSLHGLHETFQLSSTRYAVSTVQRSLSDLTPLLDVHRSQMPVILAGDLNVNPQLPWPDGDAHRAVIDRIKAFGLVDCLGSSDGDQIPTHRYLNNPSSTPYEDDWLFASPTLRLLDCQPVDTEEGWALSDHCPVVARFELHSPH